MWSWAQPVLGQADTLATIYERGVDAYERGQMPIAIETFERAYEMNPENVDVLLYLGMAHTRLGQNSEAVGFLTRARDLSPNYWDVRVALARGLVGIDEHPAALAELAVVLRAAPGHVAATHLKARIDNRLVESLPVRTSDDGNYDDLAAAFEQGMAAYRIGDARRAGEAFEAALKLSPDNVDALLFLGTVYSWRKRFDEALALLGRARELDPSYADVAIAIARVKLWQGKLDAAMEEIQRLLIDAPGRVDAVAVKKQIEGKMASVALATESREPSLASGRQGQPIVPAPESTETRLATDGPGRPALPAELIEVYPDPLLVDRGADAQLLTSDQVPSVVAAFTQGMDAFRAGDAASAIPAFERALEHDDSHVDARLFLGIVLGWDSQYDRALDELRLARRDRVEYPDVDVAIARILMWQGELPDATAHVDRVLEIYPDHADAIEVRREIRRRRVPKWRVDMAYERSTFDSGSRDDWNMYSVALSYRPASRTAYTLTLFEEDRGSARDETAVLAANRKIGENWRAGLQAAVTSSAEFKEDWHVAGTLSHRLRQGDLDIGDTWINLEVRDAEYGTGNVSTTRIGFEQYLMANRVAISGQGILAIDENGDDLTGWLARVDLTSGSWKLFLGAADAPETEFGETVDTRSIFSGVTYSFWDRYALRLAYTREDREERYVRKAVTGVFTAEF